MGPKSKKSEPAVEAIREGARFTNVNVGLGEDPCSVLVNLNCRLDILLDGVRNQALRQLLDRLTDLKGNESATESFEKINAISQKLHSAQVKFLDLADSSGNIISCRPDLTRTASDIMRSLVPYKLGIVDEVSGEFSCLVVQGEPSQIETQSAVSGKKK